ncbi:MAG: hypothetical protein MUC96_28005 [Myxococcaceae bacterium]|jgi:hypothetical protein|nr:hypothetical protein [Myxococcaceae bacterium]
MRNRAVLLLGVLALAVGCDATVTEAPSGGGAAGGTSGVGGGASNGGGAGGSGSAAGGASGGGGASSAGGGASGGGEAGGSGSAAGGATGGGTSGGGTAGGTSGGGTAGGATGGGGAAGGSTDAGTIGLFVAIGHVERSTISCDDGRTWVANQSGNDAIRCFTSAPDGGSADCDHRYGSGRGIAWTARAGFVGNWGWGDPGVIRQSRDGVSWSVVDRGSNFASMVAGADGTLFAASRSGKVSRNDGATWAAAGTANLVANGMSVWNVRRGGFGGTGAGVYVVVADSNTAMVSDDLMTWRAPMTYPSTCGANIQWEGGVASGNGVLVILGGDGVACRSTDNGTTWTAHTLGGDVDSRLVWTGAEFVTFGSVSGQRRRFTSPDGMTWSSAATTLRRGGMPVSGNGPAIGAVARSPRGTWVAANAGWQVWYTSQRFYRSTDGLAWDELPAGAFAGSHPVTHIAWGEAPRPSTCP